MTSGGGLRLSDSTRTGAGNVRNVHLREVGPHGIGTPVCDVPLNHIIERFIHLPTNTYQVVAICGRLPLLLAIAGSMPVVKGKGLAAGAWKELIKLFENVTTMMWEPGEESRSLDVVLGASFNALAARKREELLKMAVLAPSAVAPFEMLLNLWDIEVGCHVFSSRLSESGVSLKIAS